MSRKQTHDLLIAAGASDRETDESRFGTRILGYKSDFGGVQLGDVCDELELLATHVLELEALGQASVLDRARAASDFAMLADLAGRMTPHVTAWCVVSTYNPNGSFRPGQDVTWSGHSSREEAERLLPLWEKHLNKRGDAFKVDYRPINVSQVRVDGWEGPRR